jgi:predicted esterase
MIEHVPEKVENALIYFHTAGCNGDEIVPFIKELKRELPTTYIWSADGYIGGSSQMGKDLVYGGNDGRYWFTFPMQDSASAESYRANIEAMGAVLACCGAYINAFIDGIIRRFDLSAKAVVLCGHQHGSCAALAAAMVRKRDPYQTVILFDPYPLETYYLKEERDLPLTKVVCVDTVGLRERNKKWLDEEVDRLFQCYGMNTETVTLTEGGGTVDAAMFREAIKYVKEV